MRLADTFSSLRATGSKGLVLFVTGGDQDLLDFPHILQILEAAGADVIEVGIPFSDPFGEGPVIQGSSQRALENGATPPKILNAVAKAKLTIPVVTMGYYNPILKIGLSEYAQMSQQAGSVGTIVSDLVPDEADDWCEASAAHGLDTIFLAAPTSTDSRLDSVCKKSSGFVYAVSRTGVTGAATSVPEEVSGLVSRIRKRTNLPVSVGFGISKPEHVKSVHQVADAAVVGSALVQLLHDCWGTPGAEAKITAFLQGLKN
jgi:tryptophan synthase alpha chain